MAKSKINESHTLNMEGVLNIDDLTLEIEEIGVKDLKELLAKFNGDNVSISIRKKQDIIE